jgi:hypothetical protein
MNPILIYILISIAVHFAVALIGAICYTIGFNDAYYNSPTSKRDNAKRAKICLMALALTPVGFLTIPATVLFLLFLGIKWVVGHVVRVVNFDHEEYSKNYRGY